MVLRWFMGLINRMPGWFIELINRTNHVVQRELGFPLRGRTKFPESKARVIYPAILTRKHREWTKKKEAARQ